MLISGLSPVTAMQGQQRRRALIGLTPLIDVIFVVLIFFMLAGRLAAPDASVITPPDSTSDRQPEPRQIVLLLAAAPLPAKAAGCGTATVSCWSAGRTPASRV